MQFLVCSGISLANSFIVVEISDDFYFVVRIFFVIIAGDARGIPETFFYCLFTRKFRASQATFRRVARGDPHFLVLA